MFGCFEECLSYFLFVELSGELAFGVCWFEAVVANRWFSNDFFLGCIICCQDLPEYFEDHMGEWMEGFAKLLEFKYDALVDADEELTPGKFKILLPHE